MVFVCLDITDILLLNGHKYLVKMKYYFNSLRYRMFS